MKSLLKFIGQYFAILNVIGIGFILTLAFLKNIMEWMIDLRLL